MTILSEASSVPAYPSLFVAFTLRNKSRSQIGIGNAMHIGHTRQPVLIKPFQFIEILCLFGQHEIVRREQHREHILLISQDNFFCFHSKASFKMTRPAYLAHLHVFIEQLETGKHNLGQRTVILLCCPAGSDSAIQSSHYNLARMQSFGERWLKSQLCNPVLVIIGIATEHGLLRLAVNGQHHVYQFSSGADPYTLFSSSVIPNINSLEKPGLIGTSYNSSRLLSYTFKPSRVAIHNKPRLSS